MWMFMFFTILSQITQSTIASVKKIEWASKFGNLIFLQIFSVLVKAKKGKKNR